MINTSNAADRCATVLAVQMNCRDSKLIFLKSKSGYAEKGDLLKKMRRPIGVDAPTTPLKSATLSGVPRPWGNRAHQFIIIN